MKERTDPCRGQELTADNQPGISETVCRDERAPDRPPGGERAWRGMPWGMVAPRRLE
jgi:hypothetical protein